MKTSEKRMLKSIIEFMILMAFGISATVEGISLEHLNRPKGIYDRVGGGNFLLGIGVALIAVAGAYLFSELKKYRIALDLPIASEDDNEKPKRKAMIVAVSLTALYIFLMPLLGYLFPTVIFFVLNLTIFKLAKSQILNVFLGVCVGIVFFIVFIHALGMFFPQGLLGLDFGVK